MSNPIEAEDLAIAFENRSGDKYSIGFWRGVWTIARHDIDAPKMIANFNLLADAEDCAETLKRSV